MFVNFFQLAGEVLDGALLELGQADPAIAGLDHASLHAHRLDLLAGDGDREAAVFGLAQNHQQHFGVGLASHALDRVVEGEALDGGVVNPGDQVA